MRRADPHAAGLVRRFLVERVRPYWGLQVEIGVCLLLVTLLELVDPLILRAVIDNALGDGSRGLLALLVGLLGLALVFRVGFRLLSVWLFSYSGLRILFEFRQKAFEHVTRLSTYFFRGERAGDILARLTSDIDVLQTAAAHTVVKALQDALTIAFILAALVWLDARLTLILLLVYPLLGLALARINRRLRFEGIRARDAIGDLFTFLSERIDNMRVVQEFRREKAEARGHVRASRPVIDANLKLSFIGAGQVSLADLMSTSAFIVVFLLGGYRVLAGSLTVGTLVAFYALAQRLYRPISQLIDVNVDLQIARASLARVYELLDTEPEVQEAPDATVPAPIRGAIRLDGVGLRWPDGTLACRDVTLRVEPGQRVALVGPSGGGKSTLAAMLARALDPQTGALAIDGLDLRRWKLRELRQTVGLVPQETLLFHDTLAANLRLARRDASDAELVDALESVMLGPFLAGLPDGLGTIIGEHGLRLSGGERQRLALARALLKAPVVHVLDEATSALDPLTERRVLRGYYERAAGRTVILIAHRLTSVTDCDRIFVIEAGHLVESGSHAELYGAGGLYRRLFDEQAQGLEIAREPGALARHCDVAPDLGAEAV